MAILLNVAFLKKGKSSINDYALKFDTLAAATGWNERLFLTTYWQRLEPNLWLHLTAYDDAISHLISTCPCPVVSVLLSPTINSTPLTTIYYLTAFNDSISVMPLSTLGQPTISYQENLQQDPIQSTIHNGNVV